MKQRIPHSECLQCEAASVAERASIAATRHADLPISGIAR